MIDPFASEFNDKYFFPNISLMCKLFKYNNKILEAESKQKFLC